MDVPKKSLLGSGNEFKGPEVGSRLVCSQNRTEASVAGLEAAREVAEAEARAGTGPRPRRALWVAVRTSLCLGLGWGPWAFGEEQGHDLG